METSGQIHAVTVSLRVKEPMVPTKQEAGWYSPPAMLDNVLSVKSYVYHTKHPGINKM